MRWKPDLRRFVLGLALVCLAAVNAAADNLFITDGGNDRVRQCGWPVPGVLWNLIPTLPSGLDLPVMLKVGPDGMLYVTAQGAVHGVLRYFPDGTWDDSFVLPAGGSLNTPVGLAFHPHTGRLYVSDIALNKVVAYDLDLGTVVAQYTSGLNGPTGLCFDAAGNLYACNWGSSTVAKLALNGNAFAAFISSGSGASTLSQPEDVLWQGSQLYVSSFGNNKVLRYSALNGAYLGPIQAPSDVVTLSNVLGLAADPDGDVYVSCNNTGKIERFQANGGGYVGTYCVTTNPIGLCFYKERRAPFPARAREVVATYLPEILPGGPDPDGPTVILVDGRTGGPTGRNWPAPFFSNEIPLTSNSWTYRNLGPVFAIAIDTQPAPNIFVAATTAYGPFPFGPAGGGGVYKLSGCDGSILHWIVTGAPVVGENKLPNAHGNGLGDICYDRWHDQFFVSNFEDGKIYRFKDGGTKGNLINSWDPFGANLDTFGVPQLGDRIWGLHVFGDAPGGSSIGGRFLIFSVWLADSAHMPPAAWPSWLASFTGTAPVNNALFYVELDASGAVMPSTLALLKVMPYLDPGVGWLRFSNPVSDITSTLRFLFTAEKTMTGPGIPGVLMTSHYARTLRFMLNATHDLYKVGDVALSGLDGCNSAGGVAIDPYRSVWSTADAITAPGWTLPASMTELSYGLQRFAFAGNLTSTPSYSSKTKIIDLDRELTNYDKTQPGDVELYPLNARLDNCPSPGGGGGGGGGVGAH